MTTIHETGVQKYVWFNFFFLFVLKCPFLQALTGQNGGFSLGEGDAIS